MAALRPSAVILAIPFTAYGGGAVWTCFAHVHYPGATLSVGKPQLRPVRGDAAAGAWSVLRARPWPRGPRCKPRGLERLLGIRGGAAPPPPNSDPF